jgi:chemotaxis family two-component system response regulator Rcp1
LGVNYEAVNQPRQLLRPIDILLVEDNPGDADLTRESLAESPVPNRLHVVADGVEALAFLNKDGPYGAAPTPQLILLDLNLPRKDGREVLRELKTSARFRPIPVLVFSSSELAEDIEQVYALGANAYVTKPLELAHFERVMASIASFWFGVARLPSPKG